MVLNSVYKIEFKKNMDRESKVDDDLQQIYNMII